MLWRRGTALKLRNSRNQSPFQKDLKEDRRWSEGMMALSARAGSLCEDAGDLEEQKMPNGTLWWEMRIEWSATERAWWHVGLCNLSFTLELLFRVKQWTSRTKIHMNFHYPVQARTYANLTYSLFPKEFVLPGSNAKLLQSSRPGMRMRMWPHLHSEKQKQKQSFWLFHGDWNGSLFFKCQDAWFDPDSLSAPTSFPASIPALSRHLCSSCRAGVPDTLANL